ncbi:UNVERIFIED_CONTAM: 60S ribosomal protein L18a-2 [Sesamum calycinum]|uniref:60S ribosomal protein L18a-2 n=1 Tax=Sesamum calycinum TaxID=2727403 RepID=A0AAW2Q6R4_9LAMI
MSGEGGGKTRSLLQADGEHSSLPPPNYYYGTFQGVANYQPQPAPPSHSVMGFPQPVPPPGFSGSQPQYYPHGYQTVHGYIVAEGRPIRQHRLPCCGLGIGWFLFIIGFFMGAIPWYIGAFLLLCVRLDYREKPGLIACALAFHQYQVVGRALPTETDEHPKIYRMKLWATNEVRAKSKFWYFLRKLKKVKKSNGQILAINEIFEKNPTTIKNYGIWLRYQSRTGYHNMYKEYRDTTLNGAVEQMYTEMASRHRVRHHCIQIIKTATIPAKLCKRESTKQFHDSKIKFPLVFRKVRPPTRKLKTTYKATRPNLFM